MRSIFVQTLMLMIVVSTVSCSKKVTNNHPKPAIAVDGNSSPRSTKTAVILVQPMDLLDLELGVAVEFNVLVSGEQADYLFRWYRNDVEIPNSNAPVLNIDPVARYSSGQYHVTILNRSPGALSLQSDKASLTIKMADEPPQGVAPSFVDTSDFVDRAVAPYTEQSYTASVRGENLEFTWYFKPLDSTSSNFFIINNADSKQLSLGEISDDEQGLYYLTVTNEFGTITSPVSELKIVEEPGPDVPPAVPPVEESNYVPNRIASGYFHTCGIKGDALYCWGNNNNSYGALGNGNTAGYVNTPTLVEEMKSGVTQVVAGLDHTCAIKNEKMFCWGRNDYGQVGIGEASSSVTVPREIIGITDISTIAAGPLTTCAISKGKLICWGQQGSDYLMGDTESQASHYTPKLSGVNNLNTGVTSVSLGRYHNCAVQNGGVKCWGRNGDYQLGNGDKVAVKTPPPHPISTLSSGVTSVSVGLYHTCLIHQGDIKCVGHNTYGSSGYSVLEDQSEFRTVTAGFGAGVLTSTEYTSCAISFETPSLKCWGHNYYGAVGIGGNLPFSDRLYVYAPTSVIVNNSVVEGLSSLGSSSFKTRCLVTGVNEEFYCWGLNDYRQVEFGYDSYVFSPSIVVVNEQ